MGPAGQYLGQRLRMKHPRTEHYMPRLVDRQAYPLWVQGGAREIEARAREWVEPILRERPPETLDRRAGREQENVVADSVQGR